MTLSTDIKKHLYAYCLAYVEQRIATARQAMEAAQEAANAESKSSAGDKYETTRAMMQIERDRHATQLTEAQKLKHELENLSIDKQSATAQPGSLVVTSQNVFFIAVSVGKITFEGKDYFAISLASPIGKLLHGRKVGDKITFQQTTFQIVEVF